MRNPPLSILMRLALATVGSLALAADYGVQATFSHAEGNLKTTVASAKGYGGGIFMDIATSDLATWRPRLDVGNYDSTNWGAGNVQNTSQQWTTVALGVDYLRYYGSDKKGLYLTAGLASATVRQNLYGFDTSGNTEAFTKSTTHFQVALGLGYVLTSNWEGNLRYTRTAAEGMKNLSALTMGVAYRFSFELAK